MKKLAFSLFFLLIYNLILAQSTFTLLISDSADNRPGDILELSDHSFILSSGMVNTSTFQCSQRFFKINQNGIITHDSIFENPNGSEYLSSLSYINDTNIFCIGGLNDLNEKGKIWVAGIDTEFNMQWNKKYQTNYDYLWGYTAFINSQNKIIYGTSLYNNPPDGRYKLLLQEFSLSGDSIRSTIDSSVVSPLIFSIMEFPGVGNYKAAVMGYSIYSPGQILTIDSSLNIIGIQAIPNSVYNCNTMKKINDTSYYLSGNIHPNQYDYAIMTLNENSDCKKISILGQGDTIDFAGTIRSMDFSDPNKVYVGATSNISLVGGNFGQQNSWYALSSFDSVLNLRWTKYYGGDTYYLLEDVVATSDGGAIMSGTRYNYQAQSNKCDIYLVKVDQDGIVTYADNNQHEVVHDAIVYPNPGTDHMIIESGPQISGAQFQMCSIDGKNVITKTLNERKVTLNTQSLQTGTYVWQIIFNDKAIETGKWVKE